MAVIAGAHAVKTSAARPAACACTASDGGDGDGHFDEFDVPVGPRTTLIEALRWIQLHRDSSLSLRHSCLHASCGTCGVRVNGREELACVCSARRATATRSASSRSRTCPALHGCRRRHGPVLRALPRRAPDHPRQRGACRRRSPPTARCVRTPGGLHRMRHLPVGLPGGAPRPASSVPPRWSPRRARSRSRAGASARTCSRGSAVRRASGSARRAWRA